SIDGGVLVLLILPALVIFIILTFGEFTVTVPKLSVVGEIVSLPATGVGDAVGVGDVVAVGVALLVAVAVAVAVGVALFVAVAVAVAVALPVAVAVAVAVGVALPVAVAVAVAVGVTLLVAVAVAVAVGVCCVAICATKALEPPLAALLVVWNAPIVTGKSSETAIPVTYALPEESTAMPLA